MAIPTLQRFLSPGLRIAGGRRTASVGWFPAPADGKQPVLMPLAPMFHDWVYKLPAPCAKICGIGPAPLSNRPIAEIAPIEILDVVKRIEKSGRRETARKLRGMMGSVFRYAVVTLRAQGDPTSALRGALLKPAVQHRPAITDEPRLGELMCSINEYDGWPTLRAALQLLALTMTRPGDVRYMRRSEIHFEKGVWRIPAERMKCRRPALLTWRRTICRQIGHCVVRG